MDSDQCIQLCLLLLLRSKQNNSKLVKNRRWWVRPINKNRISEGEYNRLFLEMKLHDTEWFFVYTRMSPKLFDYLLHLVGPLIKKKVGEKHNLQDKDLQ